jgi:hypothetical protein
VADRRNERRVQVTPRLAEPTAETDTMASVLLIDEEESSCEPAARAPARGSSSGANAGESAPSFGATLEELPAFLRDLAGGTLAAISQKPGEYVTGTAVSFPSVGVLDHAGSAAASLRDAVECAGRVNRLLGQLTNRTSEPVGIVGWEEEDRILLAQQMITSLSQPAEQLRQETDHVHGAVRDADAAVAHMLAALNDADASRAHARRALGSITELRNLLAYATATYAALHHELAARRVLTGRWQQALDLLDDARQGLEGAHAVVDGWVSASETA